MHPTQQKIYALVHLHGHRKFRTLRELGDAIGEIHPQKVKHHLQHLEKMGLIDVDWSTYQIAPKQRRAKPGKVEAISIPILGAANCGIATLLAEERPEGMLMVSRSMIKSPEKKLFALKAVGNSMNKAKVNGRDAIEDGDFVIIDENDRDPRDGDYVLSIINGSANIKRFYEEKANKRIVLHSESTENFTPIFLHAEDNPDYFINGKVVSVIKAAEQIES